MIAVYGKPEASISLHFDGLPADLRSHIRLVGPGEPAREQATLLGAELVIVVREFTRLVTSGTLARLRRARIPLVWFTDDDLVALGREEAAFRACTPARAREFAAACSALAASTPALARRLAPLHRTVLLWPCVLDASLVCEAPSPPAGILRVGAFGGGFRRASLAAHVLPALAALRRQRPATLFAASDLVAAGADGKASVGLPFEPDFRRFVATWRALRLRAVVHPYGRTSNIANKGCGSILAAWYLGAVPIVGDEPAYAALGEAQGVLKAAPDPAAWQAALARVADPVEAAALFARLTAWCRSACDPELARAPFAALPRGKTGLFRWPPAWWR